MSEEKNATLIRKLLGNNEKITGVFFTCPRCLESVQASKIYIGEETCWHCSLTFKVNKPVGAIEEGEK